MNSIWKACVDVEGNIKVECTESVGQYLVEGRRRLLWMWQWTYGFH